MMGEVIDFPIKRETRKRPPYKGPRINKKKRKQALDAFLNSFDTTGLYALVIVGLPYDRDAPPEYDAHGGERYEYTEGLERVKDSIKGVVLFDFDDGDDDA